MTATSWTSKQPKIATYTSAQKTTNACISQCDANPDCVAVVERMNPSGTSSTCELLRSMDAEQKGVQTNATTYFKSERTN